MAYMLAVGLEGGRRAAFRAILGIGTGMSIYAVGVVLGVGTFARSHPQLLDAVKTFGVAYLLWLAFVTVRRARTASAPVNVGQEHWYRRGVLVAIGNPKIVLFFLAVLPGFLGEAQNTVAQFAMLGAVNISSEVILYGSIGMLAGGFHARFSAAPRGAAFLHYTAGIVYFLLANVIAAEIIWTA